MYFFREVTQIDTLNSRGTFNGWEDYENQGLLGILRNLSIGTKVQLIVSTIIMMMIAVAGTAIYQIDKIGAELTGIADRDIPLTDALSKVTVHQLEQAVEFERAVRFGAEMAHNADDRKHFVKAVEHFESL